MLHKMLRIDHSDNSIQTHFVFNLVLLQQGNRVSIRKWTNTSPVPTRRRSERRVPGRQGQSFQSKCNQTCEHAWAVRSTIWFCKRRK
jgi:hypothetical protein